MYNKDKIMRKLLGKAAIDSSPSSTTDQPTTSTANLNVISSPASNAVYRSRGSQDAHFDAGSPIDRISRSPDGHNAILASRHTLKTVSISGTNIQPGVDLRAAILAQPVVRNSTVSVSDQLSIRDVKWLRGRGDTTIFTACANGKIFQYDLTRLGGGADGAPMEVIHMREDSRQMNTLDINPSSSKMLAGSQDGIVRCFDIMNPIRTHTGHLTFRAIQSFKCNAGGIQCLQWSPHIEGAFYFACGTDQGVIMKWDIRKSTAPVLRIHAHDAVTSLAWHFDGDHLVSAGWDKKCCVWDVSATAEKRQKPKCVINTPAPVADLAWRPATWSALAHGKRAAQLAVTYDDNSRESANMCHIWDLARPTLPFKVVTNFDAPPRALLWHDQDLLWTGGPDGLFNQFDIAYAPRVVDQIPTSVLGFSSRGEVVAFLDERAQSRRPHRNVVPSDILAPSVSHSDSEDEVSGSFLGTRRAKTRLPHHRRAVTTSRSAHTLSTTPPGGPDAPSLPLEQSIKVVGLYRSQQAMTIGRIPQMSTTQVYEFLSTQYLETLYELLPRHDGHSLEERVASIFQQYAKAAETVGLFRLAQTWRILAHAIHLLLTRRAQYHLDVRSGELERSNKAKRKPMEAVEKPLRSLLSEEMESTSNVPTPVARPQDGHAEGVQAQLLEGLEHRFAYGKKLSPVQEGGSFTLPPPIQPRSSPRKRLDSEPISTLSGDSSTEGYDFYDAETISKAIDVPIKGQESKTAAAPGPVSRHDSDESFSQMFSISSGSRQTTGGLTASSVGSRRRPLPETGGGGGGGEYESRIRGAKLEGTETPTQSTEDDFLIPTQTTMDSSVENGQSNPKPDSYPVEAYDSFEYRYDDLLQPQETDYLPWSDDPPYPHPIAWEEEKPLHLGGLLHPFDPAKVVSRALHFEAKSSALNASAMVMLLRPLMRNAQVIDPHHATAIMKQHHSRLMGMKLFTQAALLRNMCVKGWPGEPLQEWGDNYPAIYQPVQSNNSAAFICSTCHKPREIDRRNKQQPNPIWQCERCAAVMAPCAICHHRDNVEAEEDDEEEEGLSTWWYCGGCGHGGHASCLAGWHSEVVEDPASSVDAGRGGENLFSDGACPFDGCGHACLPGKYRAETNVARTEEVSRAVVREFSNQRKTSNSASGMNLPRFNRYSTGAFSSDDISLGGSRGGPPRRGVVHEDGNDVVQSRAVETARESLAGLRHVASAVHLGGNNSSPMLSSSPTGRGLAADHRERRKSVKFASSTTIPGDDRSGG